MLQRERAEFTNFKRRTAEERQRDLGLAGVDLIRRCSSSPTTSTALSRPGPPQLAGDAWVDGITAIDRKLRMLLESEGVTAVEASPGTALRSA